MIIKVQLIRHGKTYGNTQKQYIGSTDEPLCAEGENEVKAQIFKNAEMVFSSPLKRCVRTAEIIFPYNEIILVDDIKECDFGDFEKKTYKDLKDNTEYRSWIDSGGENTPNGESAGAFRARCVNGFDRIVGICIEKNCADTAVVCHGGTIMAILDRYSYPNKSFYNWQCKNADGFLFEYDSEKCIAFNIERIGR